MFIGLGVIRQLFPGTESHLRESGTPPCLTSWIRLACAPFSPVPHLLYVCESPGELAEIRYPSVMSILCAAKEGDNLAALAEDVPASVNILFVKCMASEEFYMELHKLFDTQCGVGLFADSLLEILFTEGGIQGMIDKAFSALGNPTFVFDAGFNLIAANWEEAKKTDSGAQVIENKGFSDDEFRMANNRSHIHEKMLKSKVPIIAYNHELGFDQIMCAIDSKKDLGHIIVSAVNRPFEPIDSQLILILKKCIDQQLKKDEFVRNYKGFNYEYFIKDLLDGKIATGKPFYDRLGYVRSEFSGNLHCLVIETARSPKLLNTHHIRSLFERRYPSAKTLVYSGAIIILLNTPQNQLLAREQVDAIGAICRENELYAGLSNSFGNILDIAEYYKQALRAIELGICTADKPNLFLYEDYYLEHMKNIFMQKESSDTFCHPKMKTLFEYDKAHSSELAYTLYMYLIHERSIVAAAAAMHMHRNSLVYRLRKIDSLVGETFDSYQERHYLILSYEMNKSI